MAVDPRIARELAQLAQIARSGDAVLFTGAGFSAGALDVAGVPLPGSEQMRRELWQIVFGGDDPDDSTLADLYDVALSSAPDALAAYLARRLRVGRLPATGHHATWFAMPWRRIYTLNVDDLEVAVQREVALPRPLRTVSALARPPGRPGAPGDALDVVHLNGIAGDGADALTFSTLQYAARLCGRDREYAALAEDLARWPFVFAGTTLDEVVLWQHVELHRRGSGWPVPARPSYLIARTLSRARQHLLEHVGLTWVPASVEEVARLLAA
jgi:hypothetical protein